MVSGRALASRAGSRRTGEYNPPPRSRTTNRYNENDGVNSLVSTSVLVANRFFKFASARFFTWTPRSTRRRTYMPQHARFLISNCACRLAGRPLNPSSPDSWSPGLLRPSERGEVGCCQWSGSWTPTPSQAHVTPAPLPVDNAADRDQSRSVSARASAGGNLQYLCSDHDGRRGDHRRLIFDAMHPKFCGQQARVPLRLSNP